MDETTGRSVAAAFAALVLALGALGALAAVTAERSVDTLLNPSRAEPAEAWKLRLAAVDHALANGDGAAAVRAWRDAYAAARSSRRWEAMIELGDAAVRIGEDGQPRARRAYLTALGRARRDGSVDGVLRPARGFETLGDHDVAAQCREIAGQLATITF